MNLTNFFKQELLSREILIKRVNIKELSSIKFADENADVIKELGMIDSGSLVIDVPPNKIRLFEACAFVPLENYCPWVDTAKLIIKDKLKSYEDSPLINFYNKWSPKTAYDYFGLDDKGKNKILLKDPIDVPLPWEMISQKRWSKMHRKNLKIEGNNYKTTKGKVTGWPCTGNMSIANAKAHFERLKKVAYSIREKGYIRNDGKDGDIQAKLFLFDKEREPIFYVFAGGHRLSAYAAFNPSKIPIRISCSSIYMIKRWESKYWFNVRNNLFSESQALKIFDKIFFAKYPIEYV